MGACRRRFGFAGRGRREIFFGPAKRVLTQNRELVWAIWFGLASRFLEFFGFGTFWKLFWKNVRDGKYFFGFGKMCAMGNIFLQGSFENHSLTTSRPAGHFGGRRGGWVGPSGFRVFAHFFSGRDRLDASVPVKCASRAKPVQKPLDSAISAPAFKRPQNDLF